MAAAHSSIKASTQEHLSIEDIQDNLVILKDGSCCLTLQVTAINFGLLSENEQDAIIYAYAGLINSLTFPIQIVIRSKRKDISSYLNLIAEQEKNLKKTALKEQLKKYRAFVEETVKKNEVLDKKFYITLPFSTLELGIASTLSQTIKPKKGLPYPKSYILEKAKTNLYPKRDHLIKQLARLGLKSKQLNTQELLELFYNIYNPESIGQNFLKTENYKVALVSPAIAGEKPEERKTPMDFPKKQPDSSQAPTTSTPPPVKGGSPAPPTPAANPPSGTPSSSVGSTPTTPTPPTSGQTPPIIKSGEDDLSKSSPKPISSPVSSGASNPPADKNIQDQINQAAKEMGSSPTVSPSPTPPTPPTGQTKTGN